QDDWRAVIRPKYTPEFFCAPHLTPTDDYIIAQHVFRAPALIAASPHQQITVVPDLDVLSHGSAVRWHMDMNAQSRTLTLGLSNAEVAEHVLFKRKPGGVYPPGDVTFGFYIMTSRKMGTNPWRDVLAFQWNMWGAKLYSKEGYLVRDLEPFVKHTYNWAFNTWRNHIWQEFTLNGKRVGAPVFIVNVTQSPNYPGKVNEREFRSVWNQAWFSSLRSAQGVDRYPRRMQDKQLMEYAMKTKELALSFPQRNGFFPAVIGTEMEQVEEDGEKLNRSRGWQTHYFGNSNRNPYTRNAKEAPLHILRSEEHTSELQ